MKYMPVNTTDDLTVYSVRSISAKPIVDEKLSQSMSNSTCKIAFPFLGSDYGGSYRSAILLAKDLPEPYEPILLFPYAGIASDMAEYYGVDYDIIEMDKEETDNLRDAANMNIFTQFITGIQWLPQMNRFRKILQSRKIDIVHTHDSRSTLVWGLAANLAEIPLVWHVRRENSSAVWDFTRSILADYAVCVSKSTKDAFGPFPQLVPHEVVYNGVDFNRFDVEPGRLYDLLNIDDEANIIAYIGYLTPRKRPLLFAQAAIKVLEELPNTHAVMIGSDEGRYTDEIRKLAKDKGVHRSFHLLGYRDDVEYLLQDIDAVILSSHRHGEAFPRVVIESMASGTPVIATDSAGTSEAIIHNETGLILSENCNPTELSNRIINLLISEAQVESMGQLAKERAKNQFSNVKLAKEVAKIYDKILY